jgi:hypothetical protein
MEGRIKGRRREMGQGAQCRVDGGGARGQNTGGEERGKGGEERRWRWLPAIHGNGGAQ